jgi:transcriptional regulator of acetoin/glycerol metabolism
MPRPGFTPTPDQRRLLGVLARAKRDRDRRLAEAEQRFAERRAAIDAELNRKLTEAVAARIPVNHLAELLGWERGTVYRHLGRSG